jgi:cyclopropane-fatty-acyl-phospholipid synthase
LSNSAETHNSIPSRDDTHALQTARNLLDRLFSHYTDHPYAVCLWDGQTIGSESGEKPDFTLVLTHPGSLRNMLIPPGELSLAEAYLRGDFDIQGDIIAAMSLTSALDQLKLQDWLGMVRMLLSLHQDHAPHEYLKGRQPAEVSGTRHSKERDRAAVTYHYDTGNDFYRLFLGKWMAYSCAYFTAPQVDLDTAQAAKFEHICRKLRLKQGDRLLDIGCGWGGLVLYAAQNYGVQALGITLSQPQVDYGNAWIQRAGLDGKARLELRDYRDLSSLDPFDKVVSVGMFEHVGREKQSEYFQSAFNSLRPGGLFLNHGIAAVSGLKPSWLERIFLQRGRFVDQYVFPDGELLLISTALDFAEETGFEVRDVESLREHYALTLRSWVSNLEGNYQQAVQIKDERTYRTWRLYMAASAYGFENGQINLYQALLSKSRQGHAELPFTRADIYQP